MKRIATYTTAGISIIAGCGYVIHCFTSPQLNIENFFVIFLFLLLIFSLLTTIVYDLLFCNLDIDAKYTISLLNSNGDAKIEREAKIHRFYNLPHIKSVLLYSDDSEMDFNDIHFSSYDSYMKNLYFELESDKPQSKRISIIFNNKKYCNKSFSYTYKYCWKSLFPNANEYYFLRDTAPSPVVVIGSSQSMELGCIKAEEYCTNGDSYPIHCELISTFTEHDMNFTVFLITKKKRRHAVKFSWNILNC